MTFVSKRKSVPRRARTHRRPAVGKAIEVRLVPPPPRRVVKASRRTYFALYAPHDAIANLKSKGFWRAYRPKIVAAALFVAAALTLYQFFAGELFYVSQLSLNGNRLLPAAEVEQAAGISGWNVFFLNGSDVEASIKRLPEVQDVSVSIDLPNVVGVQILERVPRFVWQTAHGSYWVDDDGIAIRVRFDAPGLLTMKDMDTTSIREGERVNPDAFNAAVNLRNMWLDGPRVFEWSKAHGLAVRDAHGWLVYFGSASQMGDKLAAFKIVSAQLLKDKHTVAYVDVGSGLPYYQEVATKQ